MKYLLMIMAGVAMVSMASAAELFTVDGPSYQGSEPPGPRQAYLTQNNNTTLIEPVQVACGMAGLYTTQNFYLRRFYLAQDHGLEYGFWVQWVNFGVEQLAMADGSTPPAYDVVVRLYTIPFGANFTFANMTEIGSATVSLRESDVGTIVTSNVQGYVSDCATQDLVVAIDAPDGGTIGAGLSFRPGANTLGATWDAYIASADCGLTEPVAVGDIGFSTSQTIFVVSGGGIGPSSVDEVDQATGDKPETTSWGMVKALYR